MEEKGAFFSGQREHFKMQNGNSVVQQDSSSIPAVIVTGFFAGIWT